jgi:murein DD-endopeptidase MepM/ murein hydrolase activator NlpD
MIQFPVKNHVITSPYGMRTLNGKEEMHDGLDFISRESDKCYAITSGLVAFDKDDYDDLKRWDKDMVNSGGNYVIISHIINGLSYFCRYLHLKDNHISKGDTIIGGTIIGEYADVGRSFGAHLHFDCYSAAWKKIDPTFIFDGVKI